MKSDERIKEIFQELLDTPPGLRAAFLDRIGAGRGALRGEIEALLTDHEAAGDFLADPTRGGLGRHDEGREGPGAVIGPYRLLEEIGEGGFGIVYVAEQSHPIRRQVALKLIRPGMDTREVVARFEAERQALALMDHPSIARVFDGGATDAGRPYFVMELVRGIPISSYCDQCHLTLRDRLDLFVQVCRAVQHAHQKGVIHRDLKPSNVLVAMQDGSPVPKVIDFGVAKATGQRLTEETFHTRFAQMIGTPQYMSPEQAEMSPLDVDTRSDIYSLGVLLYELLTGTTPLAGERLKEATFDELRRIIREEEPPTPSARLTTLNGQGAQVAAARRTDLRRLVQTVHGDLDWIAMKALEKDRTRRYETASAFAADVERYLGDEPVEARPPSAWYRLGKFARRNRGPVLAAALIIVLLVGGIVGTTIGLVRALAAERTARSERDEKDRARREAVAHAADAKRHEAEALARKQEAEDQTAIAQAVNDFLCWDLLGQADLAEQPAGEEGRDPDVKVRTLLDRAASTVEAQFADQPRTEAAIRFTLGKTYWALGEYVEAKRHLERSIELRTAALGGDHHETLVSRHALGLLLLMETREYDRAEPLLGEVLQVCEAQLGPDDPDTLSSKFDLARLYAAQGRYDLAEQLFLEVLQARTSQLGADHHETLASKNSLALLYQSQGNYDRAEPLYLDLLQALTSQLGADHPDTLTAKNNLARFCMDCGEYDRAEALFREVLQASTEKLGADHPYTLRTKNDLATVWHVRGEYDRELPLLLEVLQARTAKLGTDHPETLETKNDLAILCQARGEYDRAEVLFREVLQGLTARLGKDHSETLITRNNLGQLYSARGDYDRALPLLQDVLRIRAATLGADHPDTLTSKNSLAVLYRRLGEYDRAEPLLREAVDGARRKLGHEHPHTLSFTNNLIECCETAGRTDEVEPLRRELAALWKRKGGADSREYAAQLAALGMNLLKQAKHAEAEPILRECLEIRERKEPDAWTTFNCKSMLGASLVARKEYAEAEPLLVTGYEGMKQREPDIPAHLRIRLTEALERLAQLYEEWGKKDEAATWRAELERRREAAGGKGQER